MGYAGLNTDELARLLARHRIEAEAIEDDMSGDHCVVRLTDMRYPHAQATLYYENMGIEPRLAKCVLGEIAVDTDDSIGKRIGALSEAEIAGTLGLSGLRSDDPTRLATWLARFFDSIRTSAQS